MQNPRATVLKLIAYITDPAANENEARTMAVRVCHLIVKHGLIDPPAESPPEPAVPPQERSVSFEEMLVTLMRETEARRRRDGAPRARPAPPPRYPAGTEPWDIDDEPAAPPPQPTVPGSRKVAPDLEARLITVLEPAWCPGCGQKLVYGRYGMWSRGEVWHSACFEAATR